MHLHKILAKEKETQELQATVTGSFPLKTMIIISMKYLHEVYVYNKLSALPVHICNCISYNYIIIFNFHCQSYLNNKFTHIHRYISFKYAIFMEEDCSIMKTAFCKYKQYGNSHWQWQSACSDHMCVIISPQVWQ